MGLKTPYLPSSFRPAFFATLFNILLNFCWLSGLAPVFVPVAKSGESEVRFSPIPFLHSRYLFKSSTPSFATKVTLSEELERVLGRGLQANEPEEGKHNPSNRRVVKDGLRNNARNNLRRLERRRTKEERRSRK